MLLPLCRVALSSRRGDGNQDVHRQPIGLRKIDRDEVGAALHQVRDEGDVAGQPIHLGDHELRGVKPAHAQGFLELWPVVALPALDLHELGDEGPGSPVQVVLDRLPLDLNASSRISGEH